MKRTKRHKIPPSRDFDLYLKNHWPNNVPTDCTRLRNEQDCLELNAMKPCKSCRTFVELSKSFDAYTHYCQSMKRGAYTMEAAEKVFKPKPFKFKPGKRVDNSPFTNGQRANRASHAIAVYDATPYNMHNAADVDYDMATDLLSDIAHLADEQGWDLETMLNTVKMHWHAER